MKFRTQYNYGERVPGEINNSPSMTVPDQSMTIQEIISRYARGLPLGGQRVPVYDGEEDPLEGVNINTLDLAERQQILEQKKQELADLKQRVIDKEKRKKEYRQEKAILKKIEDQKKSENEQSEEK